MKIIQVPFNEILIDHNQAAETILNACRRSKCTVAGICELSDSVAVLLISDKNREKYDSLVFAKIPADDDDGKIAEITQRYNSNFDIVGTFFIDENLWALYKRRKS